MKLRPILYLASLFPAALFFLLLSPSPIDPAAYTPSTPPALEGVLAPNEALRATELLAQGEITGPEDVAVDSAGRIYGACEDGRIVRLVPEGTLGRGGGWHALPGQPGPRFYRPTSLMTQGFPISCFEIFDIEKFAFYVDSTRLIALSLIIFRYHEI